MHNLIRTQYKLPNLIWDSKIEKQAQDWANIIAKKNILAHSTASFRNGMWENIYMITSVWQKISSDGSDAVKSWYSEQSDYDYTSNSCNNDAVCGHFTQIIWKSTKRIGCGQSSIKRGKTTIIYWVCQYDPPGNYVGQKPF
jgi:pathogenesis-related protein 1